LCAGVDSAHKPACTLALTGSALTGLAPSIEQDRYGYFTGRGQGTGV
jgi:hypothetical protein